MLQDNILIITMCTDFVYNYFQILSSLALVFVV